LAGFIEIILVEPLILVITSSLPESGAREGLRFSQHLILAPGGGSDSFRGSMQLTLTMSACSVRFNCIDP